MAVGAVAHVIRRVFRTFCESPQPAKDVAEGGNERRENDIVLLEDSQSVDVSVEEKQEESEDERVQDGNEAALKSPRAVQELEESPFVALAQARKDAIQRELEEKHERARSLLKFMEVRLQQAAEADARIAEELSQRGLVIKAQIPVGPTHLRLGDQKLRAAQMAVPTLASLPTRCCMQRRLWRSASNDDERLAATSKEC